MPRVQRGIAAMLALPDPATIAFAPNTHDFVRRLLSALPAASTPRILTSDSEFHSFARQIARLEEDALVVVERIAAEPFASFPDRFAAAARRGGHDLVFVSQIFFNSAAASGPLDAHRRRGRGRADAGRDRRLSRLHGAADRLRGQRRPRLLSRRRLQVRHGRARASASCIARPALPCGRATPAGSRPSARSAETGAASPTARDGSRFMGATFDPTGLYRLGAVFDWMNDIGLTVDAIHRHVMALARAVSRGDRACRGAAALRGRGS